MSGDQNDDAADREFEAMIAALTRAPAAPGESAAAPGLSDNMFDALLEEFRQLGGGPSSGATPAAARREPERLLGSVPETGDMDRDRPAMLLNELAEARDGLARLADSHGDTVLTDAVTRLELVVANMQLARPVAGQMAVVLAASQRFALPASAVERVIAMPEALHRRGAIWEVDLPGLRLPLLGLRQWWLADEGNSASRRPQGQIVVLRTGGRRVGLVVDRFSGVATLTLRPLGRLLQGSSGLKGMAASDDEDSVLILDVDGLLAHWPEPTGGAAS
jgi:chemotaxis signal transduction protein